MARKRNLTKYKHWDHAGHQVIVETRKSLQLICRQMTEEWAPLFFRSTTIVPNSEPNDSGEVVFKSMKVFKLSNIRKLASRLGFHVTVWPNRTTPLRCTYLPPHFDYGIIEELGEVLYRCSGIMESLSEVALYPKVLYDYLERRSTWNQLPPRALIVPQAI